MDDVLWYVVEISLLFVAGLYFLVTNWSSQNAVETVAKTFSLDLTPRTLFRFPSASGKQGNFQISIDYDQSSRKSPIRVRVSGCKPSHLRIVPESLKTAFQKQLGAVDVEIGDPALDAAAQISGIGEDWIRACLDAPARRAVLAAVRSGGSLEDGTWTCILSAMSTAGEIDSALRVLLAAAGALGGQGTLKARLQKLVESDPLPLVRERALGTLLRENPSALWLEERCKDPDAGVAVTAAAALGEVGRGALVSRLRDPDRAVRMRAASALVRLPLGPEARALEASLIEQISGPHALEAIDALGAVGSAAALAALREIVPSGSVASFGLTEHSQRAHAAIEQIRARAEETMGAVSLASQPEEGSLSLASPAPRGALSAAAREGS